MAGDYSLPPNGVPIMLGTGFGTLAGATLALGFPINGGEWVAFACIAILSTVSPIGLCMLFPPFREWFFREMEA